MAGKGAPKGNRYGVTHGLALIRNQIQRRIKHRRGYFDLRRREGQEALRIQAGLVDDAGGIDAVTTARFIAIRELTQLQYVSALMDSATTAFLRKRPEIAKSPAALARLFSYRAPNNEIAKYLGILGLAKLPPPQKSLEEILAEDSAEEDQRNATGNGEDQD